MACKRFFCATVLLFSLSALPSLSQSSQFLPDAPVSDASGSAAKKHRLPPHPADRSGHAPSKWFGVVDPGEKVPPLYPRDKMAFWLHEDISPAGWVPAIIATGWSQMLVGDPNYGSDSEAFGDRIGAAVLRDTSMRFFSDSLIPVLTHEDPRYFRMAYGGYKARGVYAAERVFVAQRDDGTHGFNYSDTLGHLVASAITPTYYPAPSANGRVVVVTWILSLAGDAGGNLFTEFWPDGRDALFHRHPHKPGSQ